MPPEEIDELKRDFRANRNGLLSIRDTESPAELFNSFTMFYYLNGRFPFTDGHLFVPGSDAPHDIMASLLAKFFMTGSRGLVSSPFITKILLFFAENEKLAKDFLTQFYYNLSVEIHSKDNNKVLKFDASTDLCTKIGVRRGNAIFDNHQRARLEKRDQRNE